MKNLLIKFVLFLSFLILVVFLFKDDKEYRYGQLNCHFRLLSTDQEIDYAFLGSSRSLESANATFLEEELAKSLNSNVVVMDFSRSWRASGMTYVMARDLLEKNKVKNLIVEVNSTNKLVYHSYWPSVATYSDLFGDIFVRDDIGLFQSLVLFLEHFTEKNSRKFVALMKGEKRINLSSGSKYLNNDCSSKSGSERPDQRQRQEKRNRKWAERSTSWDLGDKFESRNDYYMKKLSLLAKKHEVNLFFSYYNTSYSPRLSEDFVSEFKARYGHPLIYINDIAQLERMYESGYRDITHLKASGQRMYAEWFATKMSNQIEAQ